MDKVKIEKMSVCDIEPVLYLEKTHNIKILNENMLNEDLKQNNTYYVVAKLDNTIVGYLGISYVLDTADIISIVIDKNYTKKGIASLLLNHIFKFCKTNNIVKIFYMAIITKYINIYLFAYMQIYVTCVCYTE